MKVLLRTLLLVLVPSSAFSANGPWDGIYSCGYTVAGSVYNVYITINGQPNGQSIFAVAAVTQNTPFFGYGVGSIIGNTFSGSTFLGLPFQATATPFGFTGTITTVVSGLQINASGICTKIW